MASSAQQSNSANFTSVSPTWAARRQFPVVGTKLEGDPHGLFAKQIHPGGHPDRLRDSNLESGVSWAQFGGELGRTRHKTQFRHQRLVGPALEAMMNMIITGAVKRLNEKRTK